MREDVLQWLSETHDEPWTRYRTLVDLLDQPEDNAEVQAARAAMVAHPRVQSMVAEAGAWPGYALKRHNDANHLLYKLSTLADFGLRAGDPGIDVALAAVVMHQAPEGAFTSLIHVPKAFGGPGEDTWGWIACDAPTLLYAVLALGGGQDDHVSAAVEHLVSLGHENGWRCAAARRFGRFKGPGRREHPCPIVNVYALKALAQVPELRDAPAARAGVEMLLSHWQERGQQKYFLFGIGTDFRKLKYPFVWYDILHVAEVLSRYPIARADPHFREMVDAIAGQADENGRFTAGSMYQAWKGWSFADKKRPSPWLTFLVWRVLRRMDRLPEE